MLYSLQCGHNAVYTRKTLLIQAGVLAGGGHLLVIIAGTVGLGQSPSVDVALGAACVAGRVARAGQSDTSESHLDGMQE